MSESGELSVVTVVALVLGGAAAVVLAVAVAVKDAHRGKPGAAPSAHGVDQQVPLGSASPVPSAAVEVPAELEYPIETGGPADSR
ncbi:MAG: hypothetical protein EOO73_02210 [Myxococcales bacterium]|nr:MAG: hypothetical protein EOO73_02210 [Myxococcales bacterium]